VRLDCIKNNYNHVLSKTNGYFEPTEAVLLDLALKSTEIKRMLQPEHLKTLERKYSILRIYGSGL
jgi:hypothetical protein